MSDSEASNASESGSEAESVASNRSRRSGRSNRLFEIQINYFTYNIFSLNLNYQF